ncbi:Cytochrome P450 [Drechslerella dactyloides]|uniref:Cytochrome P450 n=1 Tax=Drechslerella dactyloides TaxID=74499 RepID=A0AAD6J4F1_DREDA|nr:Cytochrome P450 [Drechslerella dactyloides]
MTGYTIHVVKMSFSSFAMLMPSTGLWEHFGWAQTLVSGIAIRIECNSDTNESDVASVNAFLDYQARNPETAAITNSPHFAAAITASISCIALTQVQEASTIEVLFGYGILNFVYLSTLLMTQVSSSIILQYWFLPNLTFLAACTVVTVVRRLFFSSLCRFPGSKKAAMSNYWMARQLGNGTFSKTVRELHKAYGARVIRTGPNELSVNDVEAIDKIYSEKYRRGPFYEGGRLRGHVSIKDTRSTYHHGIWRRIWDKAFAPSELKYYAAETDAIVYKLLKVLKIKSGDEVNATELINNFALDLTADLTFGEDAGMLDGSGDKKIFTSIRDYLSWLGYYGTLRNLVQLLGYFPEPRLVTSFRRRGESLLVQRQKRGGSPRDITSYLLAEDEETRRKFSVPRRLAANTNLAILMGFATGTTITQTLRALAKHKAIQERLQAEIDRHLKSGGDLNADSIKDLPYLSAVINEALRLYNPLPTGAHATVSERGCEVSGSKLPPHTQVYVPVLALMTDEKYFPKGEEFIPERWTEERVELVKDQRAFIPWGYGVHACPGRQLALNEMKVTIARVIREFEVDVGESDDDEKWEREWRDYSMVMVGECMLRFKSRRA